MTSILTWFQETLQKSAASTATMSKKASKALSSNFGTSDDVDVNVLLFLRIALVAVACIAIPMLPLRVLLTLDNVLVRVMIMLCISLLCVVDPVSAIIFMVAFMIAYRTLMYKRTLSKESFHGEDTYGNLLDSSSPTPSFISTGNAQQPLSSERMSTEGSETPRPFTSASDLHNAQNNVFDEEAMNTEVRTWVDELGPQGMGTPPGFEDGPAYGSLLNVGENMTSDTFESLDNRPYQS